MVKVLLSEINIQISKLPVKQIIPGVVVGLIQSLECLNGKRLLFPSEEVIVPAN